MDVFDLRSKLIDDYGSYIRSFIRIKDDRIKSLVDEELDAGLLWPEPLIQLNPSFAPGSYIDDLVSEGVLHAECGNVFRLKQENQSVSQGRPLHLYKHQEDAIRIAHKGEHYILTTGTGSGKSLAYIIPIVDRVLRNGSGNGIKAIVVYPMNALANSQFGELEKFLKYGYPTNGEPVKFARYTGQESDEERNELKASPPDILLTNYVMLELILTRYLEKELIRSAQGLQFLVLDELHTYRGRQGADVALLVRRVRDLLSAPDMQCVGTSATIAGPGTHQEQQSQIAEVATRFYGVTFRPENIIGETLQRATEEYDWADAQHLEKLRKCLAETERQIPSDYEDFRRDPLASWIESTFGVVFSQEANRLIRARPQSVSGPEGASNKLHNLTDIDQDLCERHVKKTLLAGYEVPNPENDFPAFAFRLHQFISRGDTVYSSLDPSEDRFLTVRGQQYVPNDRERILLPLVFCRCCGQEYYCVRAVWDEKTSSRYFVARQLSDRMKDDDSEVGFLFVNDDHSWPQDAAAVIERVPDDWLEERNGVMRLSKNRKDQIPQHMRVTLDGRESASDDDGTEMCYISAPFRFCLECGVSYGFRQRSDFGKLTALGSEGRSTATTIMSLSVIRNLRSEESLPQKARKLLSFTDNRQDASLQSGHFNDFVEIGLLRAGLYKAVSDAGSEGLRHDELTQKVFHALDLPPEYYANDPNARYNAATETQRAFRDVLGYRLYRDLKRGWRVTSPNLEQCGLLQIEYSSIDEICSEDKEWVGCHTTLATASKDTRIRIAKALLDYMRRELAIHVDYLSRDVQERILQRNNQWLTGPWAIDENEIFEYAASAYPRSRRPKDYRGYIYLSSRGGYGQFLGRQTTFPDHSGRLTLDEKMEIIKDLLKVLGVAGLVTIAHEPTDTEDVSGYQLQAGSLIWKAGDGTQAYHDPINVPNESEEGTRTNPFFVNFYREVALGTHGIYAKEHTAQVPTEERIIREQEFREARLPILYCSPTMELGVDISELNVVSLRNIPPTPANYAQRSGRAGRSGQPALVFAYCSLGSPHDQYFFKRPDLMVNGAVSPPRIDLSNRDLVQAHIQAIWLTETEQYLGKSLCDILDVNGDRPTLELLESVKSYINAKGAKDRALQRARRVLSSISEELMESDWYTDEWAGEVISHVSMAFDEACTRWRSLYNSALNQAAVQNRIIVDASRSAEDKKTAERLRREAESQLKLLTDSSSAFQSDFYSYRYFASEGFLPGYNFPRLPLSAFIPGRRRRQGHDEFLSRPRFLAISEFGPRAMVYHEGSRYIINRVILPVAEDGVLLRSMKQCESCGYIHPDSDSNLVDVCERCQMALGAPLSGLFRMENVSTKRREKINSDEEERLRLGYDIRTGFRFAKKDGNPLYRPATINKGDDELAKVTYGHAATLFRVNLGWSRRKDKNQRGYILDLERGYWAKNEQMPEDNLDDPMSQRVQRVIPYVEDRKNCLLLEWSSGLQPEQITSLQFALKNAIQIIYQLEDNELAVEPLPDRDHFQKILIYESTEGGAGVLRRLIDDSQAISNVAREALRLCHFDPDSGEDQKRAPQAKDDCEAACYDCLMSYGNQRDHRLLDRKVIRDILMDLTNSTVIASPIQLPRAEHFKRLMNLCGSELEKKWLQLLEDHNLHLPSHAQKLIPECQTRPDFYYKDHFLTIYVDGPVHKFPDRHDRDKQQMDCLENNGYQVLRFTTEENWAEKFKAHRGIFGDCS